MDIDADISVTNTKSLLIEVDHINLYPNNLQFEQKPEYDATFMCKKIIGIDDEDSWKKILG